MYKPKILVAEDGKTDRYVIVRMLDQLDCIVTTVENGFEAVDAMRKNSYDLIFMDQQMPVLNGMEATRIIRDLPGKGDIPIVAITHNAGLCSACLEAGMNDFLAKPVAQYKFREILEKHIPEYSADQQEVPVLEPASA